MSIYTSSDNQIDKPQRGRPKRAELPDVNINTGAQSINTERGSFKEQNSCNCRDPYFIKVYRITEGNFNLPPEGYADLVPTGRPI